MNWIDVKTKIKPQIGRIILCWCPDWCDAGYQVGQWNGKEFFYEDQPNDMFNRHVKAWAVFLEAD